MQTPVRTNDLLNALHYILQSSKSPEVAKAFPGLLLSQNGTAEQSPVREDERGDAVPLHNPDSAETAAAAPHAEDNPNSRAEIFLAGDDYYRAKAQLITDEQILLRVLCFEMNVEHPHKYLLNICRLLQCGQPLIQLAVCLVKDPLMFLPSPLLKAVLLALPYAIVVQ